MGAFLGDALGAPHEFKCNRSTIYTGKLQHKACYISQYQGRKELKVGQITDDSEMTITLLRQMIEDGSYNVIISYMKWQIQDYGCWVKIQSHRSKV